VILVLIATVLFGTTQWNNQCLTLFARSASNPINAWPAQVWFSIAGVCNNNFPHSYWPKRLTKPAVSVSDACRPQLPHQSKQCSFFYQIKSMSLPKQS